jgi:hypothetical protein
VDNPALAASSRPIVPQPVQNTIVLVLRWLFEKLGWAIKGIALIIWNIGPWVVRIVGAVALILAIIFFGFDTKRNVAYRYSEPESAACNTQFKNTTALASEDVDNDELSSKLSSALKSSNAFTCMLQHHALKSAADDPSPGNPAFEYYLSFLEFQENGVPAQIGRDGRPLRRQQLDVLLEHLKQQKQDGKQNFVFTFIHGWRHDARIGDDNVRNARLMAAYLTSFLQQRCTNQEYKRYCNVAVTVVYVGWRGARLDETRLQNIFGGYLTGVTSAISDFLAGITLFDRKPVSERIAPAVISALQRIDLALGRPARANGNTGAQTDDWFAQPRLITIGHSLGGNVLASGVKERMIDIIEQNGDFAKPDEQKVPVEPPFGDLIVLLNPASEAENWIAIQRAFRARIKSEVTEANFQRAYAVRQPPIYISLTAAHYWPANDVLLSDVVEMNKEVESSPAYSAEKRTRDPSGNNDCTSIRIFDSEYRPYYEYDTATYDLFPFFKFDFRPLAQTLTEAARPDPYSCNEDKTPSATHDAPAAPNFVSRLFYRSAAAVLRNFPFMNTDVTLTRTIGNLDPARSPYGQLVNVENDAATWYGTTHELLINFQRKAAPGEDVYKPILARYVDAASPDKSECAVIDNWLSIARTQRGTLTNHGMVNWDSGWSSRTRVPGKVVAGITNQPNLTRIRPRLNDPDQHVESQIRQTLYFSGMRNIAGPNDPFWNVRAFESAMTNHNGYVSYPLICTIFQFVMDKATADNISAAQTPEQPR